MELIYSMRRKPLKYEPPHFESPTDPEITRPLCTISPANIIAFSSPTELSDTDGDTWSGHVYVCDLDTPWNSYKVTSTTHPVSALEWDCEGKNLMVATTVGDVSVYGQKDYLLNEWTCLYSGSFPGEHIIKASFFHNGRRVVVLDKKPDAPITEKMQMMRSTPTLKGFGGVSCDGVCVITATGLVGVVIPAAESKPFCAMDTLTPTRDRVTSAAITHKNGNLLIATTWVSSRGSCVRCVLCSPQRCAPPRIQPLPAIHLTNEPVSITWCLRDDGDCLLVAGPGLTLWKLAERSLTVHKLLAKGPVQGSTTPGGGQKPNADCFNTLVWQQTMSWAIEPDATVVACSTLASNMSNMSAANMAANMSPCIVLATTKAVHLLAMDKRHVVCSRGAVSHAEAAAATPPKKTKYSHTNTNGSATSVSCIDISISSTVLLVIDTHTQLQAYKIHAHSLDIPTPLSVQHATTLLEYAMVTGYDATDILITLKHNIVEPLYERLTESFQRQAPAVQQYYYHSWLKLRIALLRLLPQAQSSVSWLVCLQTLEVCAAACSLALRGDDKNDTMTLAALFDEHHDHDKTLVALEAKTEVTSEALVLQALRRPLQRVSDIALTVLASLQQHTHQHMHHGYELWSDPVALTLLRKLVVLVRACGRGGEQISRLLARLAASGTPKSDLLEECQCVSSQSVCARVWEALPRCCVCAALAHTHARHPHMQFEYGVEPESLRYAPEPPAYAQCDTTPSLAMDSIRYMYLGGGSRPARLRECGRCGARALPGAHTTRHPLQRAYDSRFLPHCRCGGKWTLVSNV